VWQFFSFTAAVGFVDVLGGDAGHVEHGLGCIATSIATPGARDFAVFANRTVHIHEDNEDDRGRKIAAELVKPLSAITAGITVLRYLEACKFRMTRVAGSATTRASRPRPATEAFKQVALPARCVTSA
jgi:hypothetical protein